MALPALVTLSDFQTWASRPVVDIERAVAILSAASTLVRTESGRMWVDAAGEVEDDVTETQLDAACTIVKQVASRVYFNPDGNTQEGAGPFSRSVAAWASAGMVLTDDERAQLPTSGPSTASWGVVTLSRGPVEMPNPARYDL